MVGQLLGIGDLIVKALLGAIGKLLGGIIEWIFNTIITPIIWLIFKIIAYVVGYICFVIGSFILKLIDFVELLFRALAGLESNGNTGMSIELSLDGDKGDILIQLIRNPDIQQAFLSMCIVGIFLLIVTTVFQIIKVEYTTEGAKNSKTPIFQKAFKGLANLMLLPLLVVFGIVFANQLLGLLDKATTVEGSNPTISGLIFVTSASDAHYLKDEEEVPMATNSSIIGGSIDAIIHAIDAFIDAIPEIFSGEWKNEEPNATLKYANISQIEDNFVSQVDGYKYYDIGHVSKYYNYAAINYLLMLFGGVFVLKCLFFTCFGMVIRLYKCAILFIIAPVVIGMTPINEGGLGKWRTSFIGQVLAAYGTVLSINLFFVVVRVLLSIDVKFTMDGMGSNTAFLSSSFMTMLLKAIFVLAGVLLIEKFSKELGGYFGAEDAMGAGKDMANQVGDLAMKGVGAAAMVATGGASLAMKAGKAAGGIAGKIGAGVKTGITEGNGLGGKIKGAIGGGLKATKGVVVDGAKGAVKGAKMKLDATAFAKNEKKANKAAEKHDYLDTEIQKLEAKDASGGLSIAEHRRLNDMKQQRTKQESKFTKAQGKADAVHAKHTAEEWEKHETTQAEVRTKRNNRGLEFQNMVEGFAMQGRKNMFGSKYAKQFDDAAAAGAKELGGQHETAHAAVLKDRETAKQDMARDANKRTINQLNADAALLLSINATQELQHSMERLGRDMTKSIEQLANIMNTSSISKEAKEQYKLNTLNSLQSQGANIDIAQLEKLSDSAQKAHDSGQDFKVDVKNDLNIKFDPKSIKDAVMKAMAGGASTPDEIKKAVLDALDDVKDSGLLKMISDIIEKQISNLGK